MMTQPNTSSDNTTADWLRAQWNSALAAALSKVFGAAVRVECGGESGPLDARGKLLWCAQKFNFRSEPALWMAAAEDTWNELGAQRLQASGISVLPDDIRDSYLEVLGQALSALLKNMEARCHRQVASTAMDVGRRPPEGLSPELCEIRLPDGAVMKLYVIFPPALIEGLSAAVVDEQVGCSENMGLLLDLELPISVSFGKVQVLFQELLKFSIGSIVELNRTLDDPVEITVNDHVIARGEIVVVKGNYGVRIREIASRKERLTSAGSVLLSQPLAVEGRSHV